MVREDGLYQLVIAGLSGSGKTTFIAHLLGRRLSQPPTPTMGMDVIVEEIKGYSFFIYDLGGRPSFFEKFWKVTIPKADLIIYLIDSSIPQLFPLVKKNLEQVLQLGKSAPVLILANKQDLVTNQNIEHLQKAIDLESLMKAHPDTNISILPISALTGNGMKKALSLMLKTLIGEDYQKPQLTIHGVYVYHREIGLPLGVLFPPTDDHLHVQIDQATLISGFYSAFSHFSQRIMTSHSHSIILRGKKARKDVDYMLFHYNDLDTALGVLIVSSVTNDVILEKAACMLLEEIKQLKDQILVDNRKISGIIDLYPIMEDIFTRFFPNIKIQIDSRSLLPECTQ